VEDEADSHPHEYGDQNEIGEISEIPDASRQIADQRELEKEAQEVRSFDSR
jgi:hypothetical protein